MKTKLTSNGIAFSLFIAVAALLSSCSTSNQLSSQNPHYHLNLVKANNHPLPADKKENEPVTSDIAPMLNHGSLVSYESDNQLKELNSLLKTDVKTITKQVKKSNPGIYRQLKGINMNKTIRQLVNHSTNISENNKLADHHHDDGQSSYSARYLTLWIIFLLLALLFYILSVGAPIFYIFALLSSVAAIIFFILWIVSFVP